MSAPQVSVQKNGKAVQYWLNRDQSLSLWDDPSLQGGPILPDKFKPLTDLRSIYDRINSGFINEKDNLILKLIWDSLAITEAQIKNFVESKISRSQVSESLKKLVLYGFVSRWEIKSELFPDQPKTSAPITLNTAGHLMMWAYHNRNTNYSLKPEQWLKLGVAGVQRFVTMNQIKYEFSIGQQLLKNWCWYPKLKGTGNGYNPIAVGEIKTPIGNQNFIFERVQQGQRYAQHLKSRLKIWEDQIRNGPNNLLNFENTKSLPGIFILSISNLALAEHVRKELMLDLRKIPIMLVIDECIHNEGFAKSFYVSTQSSIQQASLPFLR
ncbi:TPA: hypothetical protein ACTZ3H_004517 [Bacillus cereus]|uniref:hypothetical protein n=1 Tax=Bacillus cereus group TaxID=86661 RepID=UPI0010396210|nr:MULTISPECIES: hypothetical protein [Bacillus cereus group]KAA0749918.1 hypothetical protein DN397_15995 [Bacillus sp. AY1-10]MCU5696387.1 hypothetical protein [Bacillus cereus]TBX88129.1 hypothetical protein E0M29_19985 [Bacillus cereus]HDR7533730.1 hypothetical protein [Bacillus anthracis]